MKITAWKLPLEAGQESSKCPFCGTVCLLCEPEKCWTHYTGIVQSFEDSQPEDFVTFSLEHRDHGNA